MATEHSRSEIDRAERTPTGRKGRPRAGAAWASIGLAVLSVLMLASPTLAASATPSSSAAGAPIRINVFTPWENILSATVQKAGSSFVLEMRLGAPIPSHPQLSGAALLEWTFFFDTNNTTAPQGWPYPSHIANPSEYIVTLWWDGTAFTAGVVDRTPLLARGTARITEIPATIQSDRIVFVVDQRLLGNPTQFGFDAITAVRTQNDISINAAAGTISPVNVAPTIFEDGIFALTLVPSYPACAYFDAFGSCWASWSATVAGTSPIAALGYPDWLMIADSTVQGSNVIEFRMQLAAAVPTTPSMFGSKILGFLWGLDTLRLKAPTGWPFLSGTDDESEYYVSVVTDGTTWSASVWNETPLYVGAHPIVTPVHFLISGSTISVWVPWSLIGHAKNMGVVVVDGLFFAPFLKIVSPTHLVEQAGTDTFVVPSVGALPPNCDYIGSVNGDCFTTYHP